MAETRNDLEVLVHSAFHIIASDDIEQKILSPLSCLREYESKWVLEFDLPLVEKRDVSVTLDSENKVTVEARLREKFCIPGSYQEYEFNYFKKSVALPGNINEKGVSAKFSNGRLAVIIPKKSSGSRIRVE